MPNYIVYNGFWNPSAPPETVLRLVAAAAERGVSLMPLANTSAFSDIGTGAVSVHGVSQSSAVLFWDKDVRLARAMECAGIRVYNSADAIALCDDKAATHLRLARTGIPMPRTITAPMTYVGMDAGASAEFLAFSAKELGFPMVVKECYGSLGGQVYLAETPGQLRKLVYTMQARPFICQEYISQSHGEDVRIYMVDGVAVAAMRRSSKTDFRANIGNGGKGTAYAPSAIEVEMAAAACRELGLVFAGVDILHGKNGAPLICEVNASAQMTELEACTGKDVAGAIIASVL